MDRAAGVLGRAWYRAWRAWWWTSGLALGLVLVLVLGTAGLLEGMERETEQRVADFYTGDVRITPERAGAAPPGSFVFNTTADVEDALEALHDAGGSGTHAEPRLETTYLLSRRSLAEAYLFEDEQYGVVLPGVASERDAFSVGVLSGVPFDDAATRDRLQPYLVAGDFPAWPGDPSHPNGTVPLLMSAQQFRSLLEKAERDRMGDAPTAADLAALRLEITAARVDDSGPFKDVIRFPARVTGLYDSGIEALDRVSLVAPIEDVRRLLGHDAGAPAVNVLTVHGGDDTGAKAEARDRGWVAEGPGDFTQRYLGQLVDVVRVLGLTLSSLLLAFPFFMVWIGMSQQLERSRRELAVCRAIGVGPGTIRGALLRLTGRVALVALVPVVIVLGLAAWLLPDALAGSRVLPFPLGFHVPGWAFAVAALSLVVAGTAALAGALRRHSHGGLASTLRSL